MATVSVQFDVKIPTDSAFEPDAYLRDQLKALSADLRAFLQRCGFTMPGELQVVSGAPDTRKGVMADDAKFTVKLGERLYDTEIDVEGTRVLVTNFNIRSVMHTKRLALFLEVPESDFKVVTK